MQEWGWGQEPLTLPTTLPADSQAKATEEHGVTMHKGPHKARDLTQAPTLGEQAWPTAP